MWLARDLNGILCLYENKPVKRNTYFTDVNSSIGYIYLPPEWFPEITWENSPQKVEINFPNLK